MEKVKTKLKKIKQTNIKKKLKYELTSLKRRMILKIGFKSV